MVEPIRRPVHSRPSSFGARFLLYQRNSENLSKDRAALGQEIRKSVAELFDAALESRAAIAIKGTPDQHAEGATVPRSPRSLIWMNRASRPLSRFRYVLSL